MMSFYLDTIIISIMHSKLTLYHLNIVATHDHRKGEC
jgi:hypothetical protein